MINIRPVSDLRNNFTEIESIVKQGDPADPDEERIWDYGSDGSAAVCGTNGVISS